MAENKWKNKTWEELQSAFDKVLSGLSADQKCGAQKLTQIIHGQFLAMRELREEHQKSLERRVTVCAYCEEEVADLEALKVHAMTCEKHPMRAMERELKKLRGLAAKDD